MSFYRSYFQHPSHRSVSVVKMRWLFTCLTHLNLTFLIPIIWIFIMQYLRYKLSLSEQSFLPNMALFYTGVQSQLTKRLTLNINHDLFLQYMQYSSSIYHLASRHGVQAVLYRLCVIGSFGCSNICFYIWYVTSGTRVTNISFPWGVCGTRETPHFWHQCQICSFL